MGLLQQGGQAADALAVVEHIVHQDHRPVKSPDGAHLVGQRGIAGVGLDGIGGQVRLIHLVGAQGLGDGVGHRHAPEDLAIGHADVRPQLPGNQRLRRNAVAGGDALQEPVIDDPGAETQHQIAGIQPRQGLLQPDAGGGHRRRHSGPGGQGLLDGGVHVAVEHQGPPHIRGQGVLFPGHRHEALAQDQLPGKGRGRPLQGAVQAIGIFPAQGQGQHLRQQKLAELLLLLPPGHQHPGDQQGPAAGALAHQARQPGAFQPGIEHLGVQAPEGHGSQRLVRSAAVQQHRLVPGVRYGPGQALRRRGQLVQQGRKLPRLPAQGELQVLRAQHGLVLGLPQIQAPAIDEVLHRRVHQP